jgi:hypothetical protein
VYRQKAFHRFRFEKNALIHDNIRSKAFIDAHVFIHDGQRNLSLGRQAIVVKFPAEALLVEKFQ